MTLNKKQIHDLNNMNVAAQNVELGDLLNDSTLPAITVADAGKILGVSEEGKWELQIPAK